MARTDPYLDLACGVRGNRLGITSQLDQAEAALSGSRLIDFGTAVPAGQLRPGALAVFHRDILGDLYDRDGELRTVTVSTGSVFCLPQHLRTRTADISVGSQSPTGCAGSPGTDSSPSWPSS